MNSKPNRVAKTPINLLLTGSKFYTKQLSEVVFNNSKWKVSLFPYSQPGNQGLKFIKLSCLVWKCTIWYNSFVTVDWRIIPFYQLCILLKKPLVFHWVGSDVVRLSHTRFKSRTLRFVFSKATHFATAPWLVDELKELGIKATFLPFGGAHKEKFSLLAIPPFGNNFTVLSTITNQNYELYGWQHLKQLALDFPNISIKILGTSHGLKEPIPKNIFFTGWVESTLEHYSEASCIVRMVKHDGLSSFIQEGMLLGRSCIWTY